MPCFFLPRLFTVQFIRSLFHSLSKSLSILVFLTGSCRLWETPQARRLWLWNSWCTRYSIADLIQLNREHPRIPSFGFSFPLHHKHALVFVEFRRTYSWLRGTEQLALTHWKRDLDAVAWYCPGLINYHSLIRITFPLTQHDPRLISPRKHEPDNYVDFCSSPPGWGISKMLEGRYTWTLFKRLTLFSSVWPCDTYCGGPTFASLRGGGPARYRYGLYTELHCGTPLRPLSQRVDPQIPSHGVAPRLTNAPVYKGYLSSGSLTGA